MRTENSLRNTTYAFIGQIISIVLNFINRSFFVYFLGASYLGVNGLFSNILAMLSLADLGIGSAITYNMYKPLADNDTSKIKALMNLYAKVYRYIGIFVAIIGLTLLPFLDYLIKDQPNITHLNFIYLLYLCNSVVSYFFSYKRSMLIADQKSYLDTKNRYIFLSTQYILQILFLFLTSNFIIYLLIQILCNILSNISISLKVNKLYPYLISKNEDKLQLHERNLIFKHVVAMMSHRVGSVVVNSTDNLLISAYVGVYWVGLYSNYVLIIGTIKTLFSHFFTALLASVGNLYVTESNQKSYEIYSVINFITFWLSAWTAICLLILINPFINIWLGKNYILDISIVVIIIINYYLYSIRQPQITFNVALGLFWNDRYKPWFEAAINLFASILIMKRIGFAGVLWGTFISTVFVSFWVEPYILFKHGFKRKVTHYFRQFIVYLLVTLLAGSVTWLLSSHFTKNSWTALMYKGLVCLIVPNLTFYAFFRKTDELNYLKSIVKNIVNKVYTQK